MENKDSEIIKKVDSFTESEKLHLWIEYVTQMAILNNDYKVSIGKQTFGKYYPTLNITVWNYMERINKHRISPFENWIRQDKNNHDLTGIYSFYRRYYVYPLNWDPPKFQTNEKEYKIGESNGHVKVLKPNGCGCKKKSSKSSSSREQDNSRKRFCFQNLRFLFGATFKRK